MGAIISSKPYLAPILFACLVIGGFFYLHFSKPKVAGADPVRNSSASLSTAPTTISACIAPSMSDVSRPAVRARYKHALDLIHDKQIDTGLSNLRDIAAIDPGFPGINLDISDALMQRDRPEEAKERITAQIAISDCLARLPSQDLDTYCKTEVQDQTESCKALLAHIRQSAQYQRTLVLLSLDHRLSTRVADNTPPPQPILQYRPKQPPANQAPATLLSPALHRVPPAAAPTASAAPSRPPDNAPATLPRVTPDEALQHLGEVRTVCGSVVDRHTAEESAGKPTFINLDRAFPKQAFTVVVWDKEKDKVGDIPDAGHICVTGQIASYRGIPQIVVHDSSSWTSKTP